MNFTLISLYCLGSGLNSPSQTKVGQYIQVIQVIFYILYYTIIIFYHIIFICRYYNSRFDIAKAIEANTNDSNIITEQAKNLTRISTMLARTLYTLSTGRDAPQDMTSSESIVSFMLYQSCLL